MFDDGTPCGWCGKITDRFFCSDQCRVLYLENPPEVIYDNPWDVYISEDQLLDDELTPRECPVCQGQDFNCGTCVFQVPPWESETSIIDPEWETLSHTALDKASE